MKVNKIVLVVLFVLYGLLLLWPVWMMLAFVLFSGAVKVGFILFSMVAEIVLGGFLLFFFFKNSKDMKKLPFWIGIVLIGLSYLGYIGSLLYVYVLQK